MASEVNKPGSPSNEPADGPDWTRTREGAMNIPPRRVRSGGSSGGGASAVAGGGIGAEGGSSSSSLMRSITIAPGGGGGALISSGRKCPRHRGINGNIGVCVDDPHCTTLKAKGRYTYTYTGVTWYYSHSSPNPFDDTKCCVCPRVWRAQLVMRRTPSASTYAVTGSGSARRWVTPSRVAVYLTWRGG